MTYNRLEYARRYYWARKKRLNKMAMAKYNSRMKEWRNQTKDEKLASMWTYVQMLLEQEDDDALP